MPKDLNIFLLISSLFYTVRYLLVVDTKSTFNNTFRYV